MEKKGELWSKYRFFFEYRDEGVMFPVMLLTKEQGHRHSHASPEPFYPGNSHPVHTPTAPEPFHKVRILRKSCRRSLTMTSFLLL